MTKLFSAAVVLGALAGTAMVVAAGCASAPSDENVGTALGAAGEMDAGDAAVPQANGTIVITQVYSYGGRSGAKYKYDFVEILNHTTKDIDLEAKTISLQISSGSATDKFDTVIPLKGTLGASKYMLVQLGTINDSVGADLPAAENKGTSGQRIGESDSDKAANGKVAIANTTDPLNCGGTGSRCGTSKVIDQIGFGVASDFEGSAVAKPLDATHTLLRAGNDGCDDKNDNSKDFALTEITAMTKIRNTASDIKDCTPPPKPDAAVPKDSGPPPGAVDEPEPGKEPYYDAGYRPEAGSSAQAAGGDDDSCAVGPVGLGEGFGSFAPLAGLALAVTLAARRRRRA